MKNIIVTIHCSLEPMKDKAKFFTEEVLQKCVQEAIEDAVRHGEHRGFNHGHSEDFSIVITDVSAVVEKK